MAQEILKEQEIEKNESTRIFLLNNSMDNQFHIILKLDDEKLLNIPVVNITVEKIRHY